MKTFQKLTHKQTRSHSLSSHLKPHLDARLTEIKFERQFFTCKHIRVWGTFECSLEFFQLIGGECCSANRKVFKLLIRNRDTLMGLQY